MRQLSVTKFCSLPVNKCPLVRSAHHYSHLSFSHLPPLPSSLFFPIILLWIFHSFLTHSSAKLPFSLLVVSVFHWSSLSLIVPSSSQYLSLSLFVFLSVSLSWVCVCVCVCSLGVLLYFLGSAVLDWNGGLCHFYLLPHWFHNSVRACTFVRACACLRVCVLVRAGPRVNAGWLRVFEPQWGVSGCIAPLFL